MFHYTITAVELGSGDDEGYFASHKQMEHYCAKCRGAVKTVGETQTGIGVLLAAWIVLQQFSQC